MLIGTRYDFEYEDEDEDQGGDVDIENKYYNAKQMKADNPEEAIDEFLGVPELEEEKGDWYAFCNTPFLIVATATKIIRGFKGLKQAIKLEFKLKRYDQVEHSDILDASGIQV
jgi:COP9 signalosome complex subunit 2